MFGTFKVRGSLFCTFEEVGDSLGIWGDGVKLNALTAIDTRHMFMVVMVMNMTFMLMVVTSIMMMMISVAVVTVVIWVSQTAHNRIRGACTIHK